MVTEQGSVTLLNDPDAQILLQSTLPAHFAYVWTDGTPRVEPLWFHWDGQQIVVASSVTAPLGCALKTGAQVALTINTHVFSARLKLLLIHGMADMTLVDGVVQEYALAAARYLGKEQGQAWVAQLGQLSNHRMRRVAITPEWVTILDFDPCLPSAHEMAMTALQPRHLHALPL